MTNPISTHTFLFPFCWKESVSGDSLNKTLRTEQLKKIGWKESKYEKFESTIDYNEYQYFYPFVRDILYGKGENSDAIFHHFSFMANEKMKYLIEVNPKALRLDQSENKVFELDVQDIMLNVYDFNVGVLSIHCHNTKNNSEADVLAINQFGRRIFPPFISEKTFTSEMPEKIGLVQDGVIIAEENFNEFRELKGNLPIVLATWLPDHIKKLLPVAEHDIQEILDDRLFVISWYGASEKKLQDLSKYNEPVKQFGFQQDDFWSKFIYVDANERSLWNREKQSALLNEQTYSRWVDYSYPNPYLPEQGNCSPTLYGVSRYSFVSVSSSETSLPRNNVTGVYYKMLELCLVQRAAVIKFSEEVSAVSKQLLGKTFESDKEDRDYRRIKSLYAEYILFINKVYFREVTAQEQGIELYELIQKTMNIPKSVGDLDNEIQELNTYMSMLEQYAQTEKANRLNILATLFLPASFFAAILGITTFDDNIYPNGTSVWLPVVIVVIALVVSGFFVRKDLVNIISRYKKVHD